jgi:hypothetical protein
VKREVPFDPRLGPRRNLIEWVGEDERMMRLVRHCDAGKIPLCFLPGEDYCHIDAVGPDGRAICRGADVHTMTIDLGADRFVLLGSEDIGAGIAEIDRVYAASSRRKAGKELDRLTRL